LTRPAVPRNPAGQRSPPPLRSPTLDLRLVCPALPAYSRTVNENAIEAASGVPLPEQPRPTPPRPIPADARIPAEKRERFSEVAALLEQFGQAHLDAELTEFTQELWRRVCRRQTLDCRRGKPATWAASVVHVIARMNFLADRSQPVHLSFDTVCASFQANKTTVGSKATELERALRLRQHSEPGLCRREFMEGFTTVQLSNGMIVSLGMAKKMGFVPADATPG
jgi:Domain of unknown function (DUF6398)